MIDNVRLYNRVLSDTEIRYQYNKGGPIAHWKMDEGADTATTCNATISSVYDYSGQGNTGTLFNADASPAATSSMWSDGKYGCALAFDGVDDYVSVPYTNVTLATGSISVWVQPTSDNVETCFSVGDTDGIYYFSILLGINSTGVLTNELITIAIDASGGAQNRIGYITTNRSELFDGRWHNIIITADGVYKLYLDGVQKTLTVGIGSDNGLFTNRPNVDNANIGQTVANNSTTYIFNGLIDDVRIYNYALTAEQVRQAYNDGAALRLGN